MDVGDSKAAALEDGTRLGKVTKCAARTTPSVIDEQAFLTWVRDNHPEEVTETVRVAYRRKLLGSAGRDGIVYDRATGEVIPGIGIRVGEPYLSFRGEKGYVELVTARWAELASRALTGGSHGG